MSVTHVTNNSQLTMFLKTHGSTYFWEPMSKFLQKLTEEKENINESKILRREVLNTASSYLDPEKAVQSCFQTVNKKSV